MPRADDRDWGAVASTRGSWNRQVAGRGNLLWWRRYGGAVLPGRNRLCRGRRELGGSSGNEIRQIRGACGYFGARGVAFHDHFAKFDSEGSKKTQNSNLGT